MRFCNNAIRIYVILNRMFAWAERQLPKVIGVYASEIGSQTARNDTEALYKSARESIRIVSANLPQSDPLIAASERGVAVEIITTEGQYWSDILKLTKNGISVFELNNPPYQEFDIVDEKHLRAQEAKPEGTEISAMHYIVRNSHGASEYLQEFALLKKEATPYPTV